MGIIDYGIIIVYFIIVTGLGFWYCHRVSKNLEACRFSVEVSGYDKIACVWEIRLVYFEEITGLMKKVNSQICYLLLRNCQKTKWHRGTNDKQ